MIIDNEKLIMDNMNVPKLRFKEYTEPWVADRLGNIAEINPANKKLPESFIYIDLESVSNGELLKENKIKLLEAPSRAQRVLNIEDVLFQMVRPYQMNNLYFNKKGNYVASTGYAQIRTKQDSKFLFQYLHYQKFVDKVIERCTGTSYPAINSTDLSNIIINYPLSTIHSTSEQTKIASFLTAVDEKIQALKKKHSLLEQYKKGVMQQLFSSALGLERLEDDRMNDEVKNNPTILNSQKSQFRQLRFKDKDGKDFPEWEKKKLGEVCMEHQLKNKNKETEEVFSVAKHKGVINQIEHLGRSFSAKEILHYKLIFPGDLVYTKSPTSDFPFGIIKQNRTGRIGVVSPLYCVFQPTTYALGHILHEYFNSAINTLNYLSPLVQKGAKNTMNINNDTFLNGAELLLPIDKKEQTAIANFLSAIDEKIINCQLSIINYEKWKKGLLQKMFV